MSDEPKPSYVRFETRTEEDRAATIEAGHYVGKDVIYALVTPAGSKDCLEKVAEDWLVGVDEGVKQDRIPSSWGRAYREAFTAFKESREVPEFGTPISNWAAISPAQVKMLLDINVRTVEQLAEANEETVQRIGMGGRAMKQKAQAWLDSADQGKTASELEKLRVQVAELLARDEAREGELVKLKAEKPKEKA